MIHLVIKNVGPIKNIELDLKKYNFFIGPQSSGKSTIVKVLSTCSWVEKEVATSLDEKIIGTGTDFRRLIEDFHNMRDYFSASSIVRYETESVIISYEKEDFAIKLKPGVNYHRKKISYTPAERNFVSRSELQGYEYGFSNLRSFLYDWRAAREFFDTSHKSQILNLDASYFYDKESQSYKDKITGESYGIPLSSASSGLQSIVPLIITLQYYSDEYFRNYVKMPVINEDDRELKMRIALMEMLVLKPLYPDYNRNQLSDLLDEVEEKINKYDPKYVAALQDYQRARKQLFSPESTRFIVEEPEQNLFPYTQLELLDFMLQCCKLRDGNTITITTHSPYIINALNVYIMRYAKDSANLSLNPDDINVYAVRDGGLINLMQENVVTGLKSVDADDLSEAIKDMYDEYKELKKL